MSAAKKAPTALIAIDPGIGGAVALLIDGQFAEVSPMTVSRKKSGRNEVDAGGLFDLMREWSHRALITNCLIERVSAMPGQGVSSMFSLGDSFGTARGIAYATCERVEFAVPVVWKRAMGLSKDKAYSLTLARRAFPRARAFLARKKDEGKAEALLLARYGHLHLRWE